MLTNIIGGALLANKVRNYKNKESSGALNAPEASLLDVDTGKYAHVQNPYLAQLENNSYQQSWWDKVGNWIGFNTKEDSYRLELERLAKEWDSNVQMQNVTDDYNSESSQAARQRAAGINPDLNGVDSGSASSSTPSSPDSAGLAPIEQMTTFQEVEPVLSTVSGIVRNALGDVSGLLGMFQDLRSRSLSNDASLLNNITSAYDFGFSSAEKNHKFEDVLKQIEGKTDLSDYDLVDGSYVNKKTGELLIEDSVVQGAFDDYVDRFGMRNNRQMKRYYKSFRNGFMDFLNGQVGQLKARQTGNELTSAKETGAKQSVIGLNGDLNEFFKPLAPDLQNAYRFGVEADAYSLKVQSEYYKAVSGFHRAMAENKSNEYKGTLYGTLDASKQAEVVNTSNEIQKQQNALYLKNDLPAINARIEKLRAECDELVAKWQKSFMQTNSKIVSVFGEDGFGRYILQSLVGDINGNVFKTMQSWQDRNMMILQQMTDIVNNLKP